MTVYMNAQEGSPVPRPHVASEAVRLPYAFAVCQVGAEAVVKAEVLRLRPGWRPAFARPGLVTWKCVEGVTPDEVLPAVFVRAYGASMGAARSVADVVRWVATLGRVGPLRLHVFERDGQRPGARDGSDGTVEDAPDARADAVRAQIMGCSDLRGAWADAGTLRPGDLVLDVVVGSGDDEPWLLGLHRHGAHHLPYAGGRVPLRLPVDAPSRAWLKLEEGLAWSGLPLRAGQCAVEIGSAPGGASWALLSRGLTVVGVDPGQMDARVLAQPRFTHVHTSLGELRREQLPARVDWLLLDVNLAPQVALHGLRRLAITLRDTLRGALLTLKLNDWQMAEQVPRFLDLVRQMGFTDVRAKQLVSNRQEICVAAQRSAGITAAGAGATRRPSLPGRFAMTSSTGRRGGRRK